MSDKRQVWLGKGWHITILGEGDEAIMELRAYPAPGVGHDVASFGLYSGLELAELLNLALRTVIEGMEDER